MNKTAIKNYAVWARRKLIESVKQRAFEMEITDGGVNDPSLDTVAGRPLGATEKAQRAQLISEIRNRGYDAVMEQAAYTWFNRFIALRFMEVNGYLPTKIRVFTDENGEFKPEILKQALSMDLDGLDRNRVLVLKDEADDESLYQYLLIIQCNALNEALPYMFETISNWTELLFPANLLRPDSVLGRMISDIPEEDWTDAVEIIGWLYQYYNTEQNELVYDGSMSKSRISKELLPAATTMYTPDWAVHYMVENSLGRFWMEGHPDSELKQNWKFYLDEEEQPDCSLEQLKTIREYYALLEPTQLKIIDPCMGSGHILVVLFDVLVQIYENYGYTSRDAVKEIIEHNLYGLDIDQRAHQLAYFAVMMKARQYNRRALSLGLKPHLFAFHESIDNDPAYLKLFDEKQNFAKKLLTNFQDAREYGSILQIGLTDNEIIALREKTEEIKSKKFDNFVDIDLQNKIIQDFEPLLDLAETLKLKYDIVITNPPYLGNARFSPRLDSFVKEFYPDVKSDLSMVMFLQSLNNFVAQNGFVAFITTSSWMFLTSFEKLRNILFSVGTISSLVDFGTELFDGKVGHNPIVSWVTRKCKLDYVFPAIRLVDYCYSRRDEKLPEYFNLKNRYPANQENFSKIPGSPIAYWVGEGMLKSFENPKLGDIAEPKQGLATADNNRFLRLWYECEQNRICYDAGSTEEAAQSGKKWFPYNKGGDFRKWYGNNDYVVNWESDGYEIKHFVDENGKLRSVTRNPNFYFRECASWSLISSSATAFRYKSKGFIFDVAGMSLFTSKDLLYLLGFCNTNLTYDYLKIIAPTINFQVGDIAKLPIIISDGKKETVKSIVKNNIEMSKTDWDSFETSWDFKKHPLI